MKHAYFIILVIYLIFFTSCHKDPAGFEPVQYSWEISTPVEQNMDPQILDSAFVEAKRKGYVDGLLVIRNGYIIGEAYYNGYGQNTPHNIKSVSKSFLSVITGIALTQGFIKSLDEHVLDYFPEYIYPGIDERKYDITIRHLLSMRMGIESESYNGYELYHEIYISNNWIKNTIELPLVFSPGKGMRYNTFQTHLLSAIITKATGKSTLQYATDNMFKPMKITIDSWEQDPQGYYFGGNSMYFTPREMATLGLLYLSEGKLNGVQIVPQDWIDRSVARTWTRDLPQWGVLTDYNYGYLWWLGKINGYKLYMALGYGGQTVLVFPELNLIVVTTADANIPPDVDQERPILEIVSNYILTTILN